MEYSEKIKKKLKKEKASVLDRVKVKKGERTYKGTLMPNTEMSNPNCITIKLENGYNIGIENSNDLKIEKIKEKEKKTQKTEIEQDESKPPISIISTGGTISSKVEYETGAVEPALNAEEIISRTPEITDHAYIRNYEQIEKIASEDMHSEVWVRIAKKAEEELNNGSRGVVITHGTDTMHYTSSALSFMLEKLNKPVILTGAQRSIDRGSTDASMNLICSSIAAAQSNIGEVGIVMHATMNDDYCYFIRGTKAKKMHTSRRDTFRPINDKPVARIKPNGEINKLQKHRKYEEKETKTTATFEEKTAIIKIHPESDPEIFNHYEEKNYQGYIIEGTGLGHVPTQTEKTWIPKIKEITEEGKPVAITSQCTYGRTDPNVYKNLRKLYHEAGATETKDMITETAYTKLGWLLSKYQDVEKIREKLKENLRGEIKERSKPETFLY